MFIQLAFTNFILVCYSIIVVLGALDGLTYIGTLNFLNNKIDAIQEMLITIEHRKSAVRFQGNHILDIPKAGTISFHGVESLTVISNHFPCDCHIHTLIEGPLANESVDEFTARNYCISPLEVNGKPMSNLDLDSIGRCQEQVTRENLEAPRDTSSSTNCCFDFFVLFVALVFVFQCANR